MPVRTTLLPRPAAAEVARPRLREMLAPKPGQRVLEVGPGTGYYALNVARWLEPDGTLEVLDVQQEMLDHTMRRAHALGISNIVPTPGDAQALPYPDGYFDAAYLVATLGEVPDKGRALSELRRVLKRGGRLVVGEVLLDPHRVSSGELRRLANITGLITSERSRAPSDTSPPSKSCRRSTGLRRVRSRPNRSAQAPGKLNYIVS